MKKSMMAVLAMSALNGVMATNTSPELIVNGDFSQNSCTQDWCIYNNSTPNAVQGWVADPEIEVGYGQVYSDYLQKERVAQLAPNYNTCIYQSLNNLSPGCYTLKFEYGARKERSFDDCQFSVSFNGNNLKTITPADYQIHSQTFDVQFKQSCSAAQLRFCGVGGTSNSYGAFIKSVSLVKKETHIVIDHPNNNPVINIPVYTAPVLTQPPVISTPTLPSAPVISAPTINIPTYTPTPIKVPVINTVVLNPPVINPPTYNPNPNCGGICLESHSGQCYKKQYQLQGGQVEINLDYKVITNFLVRDSAIYLTWDGQTIKKLLPCDSGNGIKIKLTASKGTHTLGFCSAGCPTEISHQACISNVVIYQKQCVGGWGSNNLMVNGDFEQNQCTSSWCIWNQQSFTQSKVVGWSPIPEIEVGKGTVYNNALGSSWVTELDPNNNSCIRQTVSLTPGKHSLSFDWAARVGTQIATNTFDVKVNGQVVKSIAPADTNVHRDNIEFTLSSCSGDSTIEFCGTGNSDTYGALIDNIQLSKYDECATFSIVKY